MSLLGLWEGLRTFQMDGDEIPLPAGEIGVWSVRGQNYRVYQRSLESDVDSFLADLESAHLRSTPDFWSSEVREWLVVSSIDLGATYIGCSDLIGEAILTSECLDSEIVDLATRLTARAGWE